MSLLDAQLPSDHEELEVRRAFVRRRVSAPDVDAAWTEWSRAHADVKSSSVASISSANSGFLGVRLRRYAGWLLAAAAAVALVFLLRGIHFDTKSKGEVFAASDAVQEVTCTTNNGEPVVVKGAVVNFTKRQQTTVRHIRMVTLATSRGKTVKVSLPDGSVAWLNADSEIKFPEQFTGDTREVRASGEVYFDVKKDRGHVFVVSTGYFTATVLGTSFNLRARSPEDASLTLVSGKVAISDKEGGASDTLAPGEQAIWDSERGIDISSVDTYPITQWKDGYFYFNNEPLVKIMQELGRWYNVSVVFEKPQDMSRRIHFIAEHTDRLADIISRLNDLGIVNIELRGGVATVK